MPHKLNNASVQFNFKFLYLQWRDVPSRYLPHIRVDIRICHIDTSHEFTEGLATFTQKSTVCLLCLIWYHHKSAALKYPPKHSEA